MGWSSLIKDGTWAPLHWEEGVLATGPQGNSLFFFLNVPGGSDSKESACNAGDLGSIPGLGQAPGEGNGNPLQYSCLENPMDREAWWATVTGVTKSRTQLSNFHLSS